MAWTELFWLMIGKVSGCCEHGNAIRVRPHDIRSQPRVHAHGP